MYRPANQLSLYEAAELMGVSYWTCIRMLEDGRLAGKKLRVKGSSRPRYWTTRAAIADFLRPVSKQK